MSARLGQVTMAFPDGSALEYRLGWSKGGESEWRAVPRGFLQLPPAACRIEWRSAPAAAPAQPEQVRSRGNVTR